MMKKIVAIYRSPMAEVSLNDGKNNPSEFLYGVKRLIQSGQAEGIFIQRGRRNTLLRMILFLIEKPFCRTYILGLPLEIVFENLKVFKKNVISFGVNDALSFSLLVGKKLGLVKGPVIALLQSTSERYLKYFSKNKFAIWILKKILNEADHIFTLSESAKEQVCESFSLDKKNVTPFYFGVDYNFWSYGEFSNRENFILAVGNDVNRDYVTMINALSKDYNIKIVSKLKFKDDSVERLNNLSNHELCELYHKAKIVIAPSKKLLTESAGLSTTLQALSCGAIVVVSDSLPMRELFDRQGVYFYEPENENSLKKVVDNILKTDPKLLEEKSLKLREKIENELSTDKMEEQLIKIAKKL